MRDGRQFQMNKHWADRSMRLPGHVRSIMSRRPRLKCGICGKTMAARREGLEFHEKCGYAVGNLFSPSMQNRRGRLP